MTASPKSGKKIVELNENEIKKIIDSRKKSLSQLKRGSIPYIVAQGTVRLLEKELERRKKIQSR